VSLGVFDLLVHSCAFGRTGWKRVFRELLSARPPEYRAASHSKCQSDSDSLDKDAARGRDHEPYEAAMAKFFPELAPFYTGFPEKECIEQTHPGSCMCKECGHDAV
jgi:hypothetical protein